MPQLLEGLHKKTLKPLISEPFKAMSLGHLQNRGEVPHPERATSTTDPEKLHVVLAQRSETSDDCLEIDIDSLSPSRELAPLEKEDAREEAHLTRKARLTSDFIASMQATRPQIIRAARVQKVLAGMARPMRVGGASRQAWLWRLRLRIVT